jgi:hypothetical protein
MIFHMERSSGLIQHLPQGTHASICGDRTNLPRAKMENWVPLGFVIGRPAALSVRIVFRVKKNATNTKTLGPRRKK